MTDPPRRTARPTTPVNLSTCWFKPMQLGNPEALVSRTVLRHFTRDAARDQGPDLVEVDLSALDGQTFRRAWAVSGDAGDLAHWAVDIPRVLRLV